MRREFPASLYTVRTRCSRSLAALISAMRREFPASLYIQYVLRCSRSLAALISAIRREFPASLNTVHTALQPLASGADLGDEAGVPCQPLYSTHRTAAAR